jgi:glutamine---fructose-6-phosphate transaminase (isomerizing)
MCGITAFWGNHNAVQKVVGSLKALSYRGYDSYGLAAVTASGLFSRKDKSDITSLSEEGLPDAHVCIGHTRWATHGIPSEQNAHPHFSCDKTIAVVHNGEIENFLEIKKTLFDCAFLSETDSEVIPHLIESFMNTGKTFSEAFRLTVLKLQGSFAIACLNVKTGEVYAATNAPALVVGEAEQGVFLASDVVAFLKHTNKATYLNPGEMVVLGEKPRYFLYATNTEIEKKSELLEWSVNETNKGFFEHFMLKEIHEQPDNLRRILKHHIADTRVIVSPSIAELLARAERIILVGCGTSSYACRLGAQWFEELSSVSARAENAAEFKLANPLLKKEDLVLAISQSGETADTLASIAVAQKSGIPIISVVNRKNSSMERVSNATIALHSGPEISVAATKSFTATLMVLLLLVLKKKQLQGNSIAPELSELQSIPKKFEEILEKQENIKAITQKFSSANNCFFLGSRYQFPIALEGAIKLKETSYIHAEGMPAAEMKHGPIALIDDKMPVVVIALQDLGREKIVANIQEIRARKGIICVVYTEGDTVIRNLGDTGLAIPPASEWAAPLVSTLAVQLLAYFIALERGCSIDKPKNLAKSVTVE